LLRLELGHVLVLGLHLEPELLLVRVVEVFFEDDDHELFDICTNHELEQLEEGAVDEVVDVLLLQKEAYDGQHEVVLDEVLQKHLVVLKDQLLEKPDQAQLNTFVPARQQLPQFLQNLLRDDEAPDLEA
jgi:hypothetical protein